MLSRCAPLQLPQIYISLYFVAWNRKSRAYKRPGAPQPRYLKFLQVRS